MQHWDINITVEGSVYVAEVVNRGSEPYYAQGTSYAEVLSNLFSVIEAVKEINVDLNKPSSESISFSVPALV